MLSRTKVVSGSTPKTTQYETVEKSPGERVQKI